RSERKTSAKLMLPQVHNRHQGAAPAPSGSDLFLLPPDQLTCEICSDRHVGGGARVEPLGFQRSVEGKQKIDPVSFVHRGRKLRKQFNRAVANLSCRRYAMLAQHMTVVEAR